MRITRLAAFALLLGSGAFSAAAGARDSSLPAGVPFTLDQAVATAFSHDPQLANAAARVAGEEATLLQAQGLFSRRYGVNVSAQYLVDELVGGRLRAEQDRRLRELVAVESACCSFVDWRVVDEQVHLRLFVTGTPEQLVALNVG